MQQCPNCGHSNRAGVVFCENCGSSLIGKMPLDTKSLGTTGTADGSQISVDSSVLTDVKVQGIPTFRSGDRLRIELEGSAEPIVITPKAEAIFGRRDPATGALPDIDLTPFAGYRMGVSRRHAALRLNDEQSLDVWDLGSSNGTFLNGQRLSAHRPYRLHDGDELRLGQMMVRIVFETIKTPAAQTPATAAPRPVLAEEAPAPATIPVPEPVTPEAPAQPPKPSEPIPLPAPGPAPAAPGEAAAAEAAPAAPAPIPAVPAETAPAPPAPAPAAPADSTAPTPPEAPSAPALEQTLPTEAIQPNAASPAVAQEPAPASAQTLAISKPPVQAITTSEAETEGVPQPPAPPDQPADPPAPPEEEKRD